MVTANEDEFGKRPAVEEDDEVTVEIVEVESRKFSWIDVMAFTADLAYNLSGSVTRYFDRLGDSIAAHSEYKRTQVDFAESVMRDVSRL